MKLDFYTIIATGEVIRPGDDVLFMPSKNGERLHVGRVREIISEDTTGEVKVSGVWYYRLEDTKYSEIPFIGKNEIFTTNKELLESVDCIVKKCKVLSERDYAKLKIAGDDTFFQRIEFDHVKQDFLPNATIKLYCNCHLPSNPDYPMIRCVMCKEWYHPRCVGITEEHVFEEMKKHFSCEKCPKFELKETSKGVQVGDSGNTRKLMKE